MTKFFISIVISLLFYTQSISANEAIEHKVHKGLVNDKQNEWVYWDLEEMHIEISDLNYIVDYREIEKTDISPWWDIFSHLKPALIEPYAKLSGQLHFVKKHVLNGLKNVYIEGIQTEENYHGIAKWNHQSFLLDKNSTLFGLFENSLLNGLPIEVRYEAEVDVGPRYSDKEYKAFVSLLATGNLKGRLSKGLSKAQIDVEKIKLDWSAEMKSDREDAMIKNALFLIFIIFVLPLAIYLLAKFILQLSAQYGKLSKSLTTRKKMMSVEAQADELIKWKNLRDAEVVSEDEFKNAKNKILGEHSD